MKSLICSSHLLATPLPVKSSTFLIVPTAYSGKRLKLYYKKAQNLDLKDSCLLICGTIHPTSAANLIKAWSGGDGFWLQWLYTAVGDDIPDAESCYDLLTSEETAPPYDLLATFLSLHKAHADLPELDLFIPVNRVL